MKCELISSYLIPSLFLFVIVGQPEKDVSIARQSETKHIAIGE